MHRPNGALLPFLPFPNHLAQAGVEALLVMVGEGTWLVWVERKCPASAGQAFYA